MNSYLNHYACQFYNETLDECGFSEDKISDGIEYYTECSDRTIAELMEEEQNNCLKTETLDMLRRLPPSYITYQRIKAIEKLLTV